MSIRLGALQVFIRHVLRAHGQQPHRCTLRWRVRRTSLACLLIDLLTCLLVNLPTR